MNAERTDGIPAWRSALYAVVVVVVFFALLELALWAVGVRTRLEREDPFWGFSGLVSVFERQGDVYRTRFMEPNRVFNDQEFAAEKPENGLRLFTLGGSSAYGYPWNADASFSGVLGDVLARALPDRRVESVNAAGVSYAMHRLRFVAREVMEYEPDLLLVYSGHNEFIEPDFFAELKRQTPELSRVLVLLSRSRLYSGLWSLLRPAPEVPAAEARAARFDMFVRRNETTAYDDARKAEIVEGFRRGLSETIALARSRGTRVVLLTVPANVRDWAPQRSVVFERLSEAEQERWAALAAAGQGHLAAGRFARALPPLEQAAALAPSHAGTRFHLGRAYEGAGRYGDARRAYSEAADLDASPVRRISGTNEVVRELAQQDGVLLVDAERVFEARSPNGLVGFNWIEDYVHPTREGHQLIAWELWQALASAGWLGDAASDRTLFDRVVAARRTVGVEHNAAWLYNQASILRHAGHLDQAMDRYREAVETSPNYAPALVGLAVALQERGHLEEALRHHRRAQELGLVTAESLTNLAITLQALGESAEALARLREAEALDPDYGPVHTNLGVVLAHGGDHAGAVHHYGRAVALNPGFPEPANNLAWILATTPDDAVRDGEAAVRHATLAVRTSGQNPLMLDTLAAAYAAAGQYDDAVRTCDRALRALGEGPTRREIEGRRALYRAGRAYVEAPAGG